ncbi:hypothetical protein CDEST_09685 [Colletotrichum destructivum]|uniref:Uncharacterized protein n=1 Tax=Colletotrichum destructivum TaxID=34406 RepID=A0AAX4IP67_9PEZI|nr:hypothetical protein CDEST_09685 [Colletotrichum destructivum]
MRRIACTARSLALNTCSGQLSHHVQTVYQNDARLTITRRHLQSILSIRKQHVPSNIINTLFWTRTTKGGGKYIPPLYLTFASIGPIRRGLIPDVVPCEPPRALSFSPSPEPHRDDADTKALTSWRLSPVTHKHTYTHTHTHTHTHTRPRTRKTTPSSVSCLGGNVPDHRRRSHALLNTLRVKWMASRTASIFHLSWGSVLRHANATPRHTHYTPATPRSLSLGWSERTGTTCTPPRPAAAEWGNIHRGDGRA